MSGLLCWAETEITNIRTNKTKTLCVKREDECPVKKTTSLSVLEFLWTHLTVSSFTLCLVYETVNVSCSTDTETCLWYKGGGQMVSLRLHFLRLRPAFLKTGRLSHLVSLLLLQFVHRPLQPLLQQVHQPHRVSWPSLKLLPEKQKFRERGEEEVESVASTSQNRTSPAGSEAGRSVDSNYHDNKRLDYFLLPTPRGDTFCTIKQIRWALQAEHEPKT